MENEETLSWYDAETLTIEGKGWEDTKHFYDRFPGKAEGEVPEMVWERSRCPSGICVNFDSDADRIDVRWQLEDNDLHHRKFPPVARHGLDLYVRDDNGKWRWGGATLDFSTADAEDNLVTGIAPVKTRSFKIYLPLNNYLKKLTIGVPESCSFKATAPDRRKTVVYYGTSIAHGVGASRPGMSHPMILGRKLDLEIINLGFGGHGRMESEVCDLIAELDPALFILDTLPNMTAELVAERAENFIRKLRIAKPDTPFILVEDRTYTDAWLCPAKMERNQKSRCEFRRIYENLTEEGMGGLYYVKGDKLLGDDDEGAIDSSHPSDLGMMRMAEALEPVVRKAIM